MPRSSQRRSRSTLADGISLAVANRQRRWPVDKNRLQAAVGVVLQGEGVTQADISLAVVSDATIHAINRQYLNHDEPTDVISFVLDQTDGCIDGEIVVSADTAAAAAPRYGWPAAHELLLYVVHGTLHLVGYDDTPLRAKRTMRRRERHYLAQLGIEPSPTKTQAIRSK